MSRAIIVVDTETTGLDPLRHDVCEVGWLTLAGLGAGCFVPPHSTRGADPDALAVNRYWDRIPGRVQDTDYHAATELHRALTGNTLAGSNPAFDALFLAHLFNDAGLDPIQPWHHRLLDVSAYAAGLLGIEPGQLPGLSTIAARLGIGRPETTAHTAFGDAQLTAACLIDLRARSLALPGVAA